MGLFGGKKWKTRIKYRVNGGATCEDVIEIPGNIAFAEGDKIRKVLADKLGVHMDSVMVYVYTRA